MRAPQGRATLRAPLPQPWLALSQAPLHLSARQPLNSFFPEEETEVGRGRHGRQTQASLGPGPSLSAIHAVSLACTSAHFCSLKDRIDQGLHGRGLGHQNRPTKVSFLTCEVFVKLTNI